MSDADDGDPPVWLVKGEDPAVVAQAAHRLVAELVGDGDPSLSVEEFGGPAADQLDVGAIVDACTTPPFLVERRVVVVRDAGQLTAADAARMADYLADPLPTTVLVLVSGGGAVPAALSRAATRHGRVLDASVGTGRARSQWLADQVRHGPVRLDAAALAGCPIISGRTSAVWPACSTRSPPPTAPGPRSPPSELEPFLGEAGSTRPVGPHRRHRRRRHGHGPRRPAPDADGRRLAPAGRPGHPAPALPAAAAPRRLGCDQPRGGGRAARAAELVPGPQGPGPVPTPGLGPHRPGRHAAGRGRPGRAGHERAARGGRPRGPGGPAEPPGPAGFSRR